ncbi:uL22 family ribosomal protein [Candidatus Shapirobacteria bacterium]|nr:uL22 family ribosomal protein [Candidatus Shapirobacteria bacterium]
MATTIKKTTVTKKSSASKVGASLAEARPAQTTKSIKYSHSNLKVSPRKLRVLTSDIKKMAPAPALARLQFTNTNAGRLLHACLKTAIANAKSQNILPDTLKFTEVRVDEGQKIKRMDKSHGSRFARGIIIKRHSRLNIILSGTIQS